VSTKKSLTITDVLLIAGFCLFLILISPILIPLLIYAYAKNKFESVRLRRFLARNEGAKYFCYTNKQTGLAFAREKILPNLNEDVQVIYMSQKGRMNLGDESLLNTLIGMEAGGAKRGNYPCVAKVVKGKLTSESLNTEYYRTIARKVGPENLLKHINEFYETSN
jgi:hypothetical protein